MSIFDISFKDEHKRPLPSPLRGGRKTWQIDLTQKFLGSNHRTLIEWELQFQSSANSEANNSAGDHKKRQLLAQIWDSERQMSADINSRQRQKDRERQTLLDSISQCMARFTESVRITNRCDILYRRRGRADMAMESNVPKIWNSLERNVIKLAHLELAMEHCKSSSSIAIALHPYPLEMPKPYPPKPYPPKPYNLIKISCINSIRYLKPEVREVILESPNIRFYEKLNLYCDLTEDKQVKYAQLTNAKLNETKLLRDRFLGYLEEMSKQTKINMGEAICLD
ncbi:unnamed protein product [Medioppia subpectinata]|uniref:Uncharacterized protein n=1 Tax=Medioppia subpectinata TaxID=1979941 RepID=A0A7R9Q2V0_9ACAR|nr:unnamed protein product [Medioppia subpectinata]CAG2109816.1 unnamed protein product [Medioppia subpectinata]